MKSLISPILFILVCVCLILSFGSYNKSLTMEEEIKNELKEISSIENQSEQNQSEQNQSEQNQVDKLILTIQLSELNNRELMTILNSVSKENDDYKSRLEEASRYIIKLIRIIEDLEVQKST